MRFCKSLVKFSTKSFCNCYSLFVSLILKTMLVFLDNIQMGNSLMYYYHRFVQLLIMFFLVKVYYNVGASVESGIKKKNQWSRRWPWQSIIQYLLQVKGHFGQIDLFYSANSYRDIMVGIRFLVIMLYRQCSV